MVDDHDCLCRLLVRHLCFAIKSIKRGDIAACACPLSQRTGVGIHSPPHSSCKVCVTPRLHAQFHSAGHADRILCLGNGRVHQHPIASQLHRHCSVTGCADSSINDYGYLCAFNDQADCNAVLYSKAGADRGAKRHNRHRACIFQLLRRYWIIHAIDHWQEAILGQCLCCLQRFAHIGIERTRLPQHLQLYQVPTTRFARKAQGTDCFVSVEASCSIGKIGDLLGIDVVG